MAQVFNKEKFSEISQSYNRQRGIIILIAVLIALIVTPIVLITADPGISSVTSGASFGITNAIGIIAVSYINAIGIISISYVNNVSIIAISPISSLGIVAIGGVNAAGIIAISGVNAIGIVAIGRNAIGIVAIGNKSSGMFSLAFSPAPYLFNSRYMLSADKQDKKAVEFFTRWMPRLKNVFSNTSK